MADLKFTADYSDLSKTVDVLVKIGKASDDTAKAFGQAARQIVSWQQKFAAEQGRVNSLLEANYQKQNLSNKSAKESATIFKQQAVEIERLAAKYKPLYAASMQYEKALEEINKAHKLGVLNAQQHEAAMEKLNREYTDGTGQFSKYSAQASMRLNQVGVGVQQVGYQVGDFLVQVQSGTNAFVAFGQQATQLVGVLPMFATQLGLTATAAMGIAAGLGIAIPLVTAIGAAIMRSTGKGQDFVDVLGELDTAYTMLEDVNFDSQLEGLDALAEKWQNVLELANRYAMQRVEEAAASVVSQGMSPSQLRNRIAGLELSTQRLGPEHPEVKLLETLRNQLVVKEGIQSLDMSSREALSQSYLQLVDNLAAQGLMNDEVDRMLGEFQDSTGILSVVQKTIDNVSDAQKNAYEWAAEFQMAWEEHLDNLNDGGVAATEYYDKLQAAQQYMSRASGEYYQGLLEQGILQNEIADKIQDALKDSKELSSLNISKGIADAAEVARMLADRLGVSLSAAREMVNIATNQVTTAADNNGPSLYNSKGELYLPVFEGGTTTSTRSSGGGGKTPAELLEEYMAKAEREVDLKTRQVGLSEEAARVLELEDQYKLRGIELDKERISALASQEEALRKATEAEKQREDMIDSVQNNIETAFTSMVDGSATVVDAFRNMLRSILLEIYKQKVVTPMAEGIMSLFMAKGGAFNKGVQMFADGGVVSSPTMFGHSGGLGMMGEAGPEAIMPLKRGPDGKLGVAGSQGNVVVNQSFNFSANGDDSVKRIIAQAAPQIAQMTQKQIMDSRRRGGQMKATFS